MKTFFLLCIMAISGAVCALAEEAPAQAPAYEKYKLIYEKNVFSRTRYTPPSSRSGQSTRREKVILSLYVLRGVAVETQSRLAFVEDQISGQWKRLTVGDQLLSGTIAAIDVDKVLFTENEQTRDVAIGQEFDRIESEVERPIQEEESSPRDPNTPKDANTLPAVGSQTKPTPPASSQNDSDVLKQMMERRRREMGN